MFAFRIRVNRAEGVTIQLDDTELVLPFEQGGGPVAIKSGVQEHSIKDADSWAIVGAGYSSETAAAEAAEFVLDALLLSFVKTRIGIDIGHRRPRSFLTEHGLATVAGSSGQRVLNDEHGLMIYATEPKPRFARLSAKGVRGVNPNSVQNAFADFVRIQGKLTERERVAISLFNDSFFQVTGDSRFLLLIMAIEAMLEPAQKV